MCVLATNLSPEPCPMCDNDSHLPTADTHSLLYPSHRMVNLWVRRPLCCPPRRHDAVRWERLPSLSVGSTCIPATIVVYHSLLLSEKAMIRSMTDGFGLNVIRGLRHQAWAIPSPIYYFAV
jgi:hypothetical protein